MPPAFAAEFAKTVCCRQCKDLPKKRRKFCETHLQLALARWRQHCRERKALGQCIECSSKSLPNQLRCQAHVNRNRRRCSTWMAENWLYKALEFQMVKEERLALGLCTRCGDRPPAQGGTTCVICKFRQRQYGK